MGKIPKEIVEKVELRNKLNEEIREWCNENIDDMEDFDVDYATIEPFPVGQEQRGDGRKEWCEQHQDAFIDDIFWGEYYWETEVESKFLHMHFDC